MKRTMIFLALASLVLGTSGCGSCRGLFAKKNKSMATPVYSQYAPACAPACNTCNSGGAVSYAYGSTPATVTMPQMYQQMPMAESSSECSSCAQ